MFRRNFKKKLGSSPYWHTISVCTCFCVCICLIFRFTYLAYYCFSGMLFSVCHLGIVNIFCCLYYIPGVYLKSSMSYLRWVYCLGLLIAQYLPCRFCNSMVSFDLCIVVWMLFLKYCSKLWFSNSCLMGEWRHKRVNTFSNILKTRLWH